MKCPFCKADNDRVVDSRASEGGWAIRRRRHCQSCERRFTTYEKAERDVQLRVIKRDKTRVPYDRSKLLGGLHKAFHKRPVPEETIQRIAQEIEDEVIAQFDQEVPTEFLGERVMAKLREVDLVAYIRFASVYRNFSEASDFVDEVAQMARRKPPEEPGGGGQR